MKYLEYYEIIKAQMDLQMKETSEKLEAAAICCTNSIVEGSVVHVYGCGHSQMFAMEVFYRAGGLVPVNALLVPHLALFPKAKLSTFQERVEGFSPEYLNLINTNKNDTMIIVSISGRNSAVIDMAIEAKAKGMKVIALTSLTFSDKVTSRHSSNKLLRDFADVVIDIKCEAGDACLSLESLPVKFNGTSTILGMLVMNCITSRTIELCVERGVTPPIYVSSNLDEGDEINRTYIQKYRNKINCL
ncbi:hypothetical protein A4S06_08795 [Erysipelotrichaceae bacterium MTC7]|nr:hypothetical protein A4S06_08795 [Erysipelotrichaceae bacterium MTC7]